MGEQQLQLTLSSPVVTSFPSPCTPKAPLISKLGFNMGPQAYNRRRFLSSPLRRCFKLYFIFYLGVQRNMPLTLESWARLLPQSLALVLCEMGELVFRASATPLPLHSHGSSRFLHISQRSLTSLLGGHYKANTSVLLYEPCHFPKPQGMQRLCLPHPKVE